MTNISHQIIFLENPKDTKLALGSAEGSLMFRFLNVLNITEIRSYLKTQQKQKVSRTCLFPANTDRSPLYAANVPGIKASSCRKRGLYGCRLLVKKNARLYLLYFYLNSPFVRMKHGVSRINIKIHQRSLYWTLSLGWINHITISCLGTTPGGNVSSTLSDVFAMFNRWD